MSVKVIKSPVSEKVKMTIICSVCGATLEFTNNDIKCPSSTSTGRYVKGWLPKAWIDCPNCLGKAILLAG